MSITGISTLGMTRDEWLAERRNGIGGSDAGAVVGLNKYRNAFDVYADKLGITEPVPDNEAMRQGRDLEEYVAQRFCEETGKKVRRRNSMMINTEYPFARANVDRMIVGENAGLECKTANVLSLQRYKNGEYPSEYYCQCMHYMAVTGAERWYLAVLVFGTEFKIFTIERDEEEIQALMQAEKLFWENNVLAKEPPPPQGTERNDENISSMFPQGEANKEIQLFGFDEQLKRYIEVKALIKKLETEKKEIEQNIKLEMGDAVKAHTDRCKISWGNYHKNTVDVSAISEEYDIDLDEYTKTTNYRKFSVTERKDG